MVQTSLDSLCRLCYLRVLSFCANHLGSGPGEVCHAICLQQRHEREASCGGSARLAAALLDGSRTSRDGQDVLSGAVCGRSCVRLQTAEARQIGVKKTDEVHRNTRNKNKHLLFNMRVGFMCLDHQVAAPGSFFGCELCQCAKSTCLAEGKAESWSARHPTTQRTTF